MIPERSQNPLEATTVESEDERNVDEQLDEIMKARDDARRKVLLENHTNNARIEPRRPQDPPNLPKER